MPSAYCKRCYVKTERLYRLRNNLYLCRPCMTGRLAGRAPCRHCEIRVADKPSCGLCVLCYSDRELREQYRTRPAPVQEREQPAARTEPAPTDAPAGSLARVAVLAARVERNDRLFAPGDVWGRCEVPEELEKVIVRELQRYEEARKRKADAVRGRRASA